MTSFIINRPESSEYSPYYGRYISLVPEGEIIKTLAAQLRTTLELLRGIPETTAASRYAPEKWSVKEVVGHIIDAERVFAYRALRFARGDQTPLPGFEQDDYVRHGSFGNCQLRDLAREFEYVREGNLCFFRQLERAAWERRGTASNAEVSVRAVAYIIAGHELHHVGVLQAKYLSPPL